jgi:hypothetical protein
MVCTSDETIPLWPGDIERPAVMMNSTEMDSIPSTAAPGKRRPDQTPGVQPTPASGTANDEADEIGVPRRAERAAGR